MMEYDMMASDRGREISKMMCKPLEGHGERLLKECALCGEVHDLTDPDDSMMLYWTRRGMVPVCGVCIADIVTPELERRLGI